MENLNKENFFNTLMKKYPAGVESFCRWIDEYKRINGLTAKAPNLKFHDLPLAMQIAVLNTFFKESSGLYSPADVGYGLSFNMGILSNNFGSLNLELSEKSMR